MEMKCPDRSTYLEIEALHDGGYVVREGRYSQGMLQRELAAFTTLDEALAWMKTALVDRPSSTVINVAPRAYGPRPNFKPVADLG